MMKLSTEIFLLRHGETQWNKENRLQGQQNSPLTKLGREQARRNGQVLCKILEGRSDYRFFSSPLGRCLETSQLIASALNFDPKIIKLDDRLTELCYGKWEGENMFEIRKANAHFFNMRLSDRWEKPMLGGESYYQVATRIESWLQKLGECKTSIVVSHGCAGRIMRGIFADLPRDEIQYLDEGHEDIFLLKSGSVTKVKV